MNLAVRKPSKQIARPLKTLIPLIQSELQKGNSAGREHYVKAGEMLIEAKDQVGHGRWGAWLSKNFDLHATTAREYMRYARAQNEGVTLDMPSMMSFTGRTERRREERGSKQQQAFRRILQDVARDTFVQERQSRDDEINLHRDLALELIDIGFRALATRLHPDRGGTKDAMARLNRVRDELKTIAQTRRFV